MNHRYAVIPAPSALGLRGDGIAKAPRVLLQSGLADTLRARVAPTIAAPRGDGRIDPRAGVLNAEAIAAYARDLAAAIDDSLARDEFPLVLGGDCSILLGAITALRKRGRYGLLFLDGHADFYQFNLRGHRIPRHVTIPRTNGCAKCSTPAPTSASVSNAAPAPPSSNSRWLSPTSSSRCCA
jgi:arginase family enzyme